MKKNMVIIGAVAVLAVAALIGTTFGLSSTVDELAVEISRNEVDAVLASANVEDESLVSVPVTYYDQVMDECVNLYDAGSKAAVETRQFEWSKCGYYNKSLEKELTEATLSAEHLPAARGGQDLPNRGVKGAEFERWFKTVEGKSQNYAAMMNLRYESGTATFSYESDKFYPLNEIARPAETVNADGNNHLFTMNLGLPISVTSEGKETFAVSADDDTWVYIDDKIVLDMGGVHGVTTGRFKIQENGEVYSAVADESLAYAGIKLEPSSNVVIRIFHADRDSEESVFRMNFSNMLLNVTNAVLAKTENEVEDGTMVAYNPDDPSYMAPLGESLTYTPNRSRMILTSAVIQASVAGALAVVVILAICVGRRCWRRDRNQE